MKKREIGGPLLWWVRGGVLAAAAGLIIYGAVSGGIADVFHKAMMICYECIGIG